MKSFLPKMFLVGTASAVLFISLGACTQKKPVTLPTGPQTLTGSLSPVELSLTRRGTHILRQNGNDTYYVESGRINLRSFEGMDVRIKGLLEWNTDRSALPVLVANDITLIEEPSHPWTVPSLHLQFSAPLSWNGEVFDDGISFTETGSTHSFMKIVRSSLGQMPAGTPLVVGGERAVRILTASGQVIYVQNGKDILTISLDKSLSTPAGDEPIKSVVQLLKSIVFTNQPVVPSSTNSGSALSKTSSSSLPSGTPCGGSAGILCPSGSYCQITDAALGIGVCRPLEQ